MATIDITASELAIANAGYDASNPTKIQETLAAIYIKMLSSMNGQNVSIEQADISQATGDIRAVFSETALPVKYQSYLPAIVGAIVDVIALTADKGNVVKEIGVNAIDSLIDNCIRVLFNNLFAADAPEEEQTGDMMGLINKLEDIRISQEQETLKIYMEGGNKILTVSKAGATVEEG